MERIDKINNLIDSIALHDYLEGTSNIKYKKENELKEEINLLNSETNWIDLINSFDSYLKPFKEQSKFSTMNSLYTFSTFSVLSHMKINFPHLCL